MKPDAYRDDTGFDLYRGLLTIAQSSLGAIARGVPLGEILTGIAGAIEAQHCGMRAAIVLLNHDRTHLDLFAAEGLPADYRHAVCEMAVEPGMFAQHAISRDAAVHAIDRPIEASRFWRDLRQTALQSGLYAQAAIPAQSAAGDVLGYFVVHSDKLCCTVDAWRQSVVDVATLVGPIIEYAAADTQRKNAEVALRESERKMALAIEGSGTGIWDRNVPDGKIYYSAGWEAILGYGGSELPPFIEDSYARLHPDDCEFVKTAMQDHFDQKTDHYAVEHRICCKDGSYKWISSRGKVVSRDPQGKALRMVGTTTDITALHVLSDKLQQSVELITNLTNEVPGLMFQYRLLPDGRALFSYASDGIRDIYELSPAQVSSDAGLVHQRIHPDDFLDYCESIEVSASNLTPWHLEYRVILPRQGQRWRQGDARPRRLNDGSTLWHGFITDITERKRTETRLQEFATLDFLTQLPNRRHFMARMNEELTRIRRAERLPSTVLMIDIDHFKMVNDNYGHAVGDLVLKHFSTLLRGELRKGDIVGRLGGEEFAVVLPGSGVVDANAFAYRLQKRIAQTPFLVNDRSIPLTVSIGIAPIQAADASADVSLSRCDKALYRAKEAGRNRIECH